MTNRVEQVTIVGGGTTGWLTAMILTTFLNSGREGPPVKVTLIESPKVPTIGVGEATVAGLQLLMKQLGIDEAAFFRRTNASFKLSVRFGNWGLDRNGEGTAFYHPFNYPPYLGGFAPAYHYKKYGPVEPGQDLADAIGVNTALIKAARGPRALGAGNYEEAIGYAYHLDAGLFGDYLREVAASRGIEHIRDDVVEVVQDERGFVSHLRLEQGGLHPVEFVVDCSGFKGLIVQKVLGGEFQSFSDHLLNDRAIPVQIPHRDPSRIEPCTRSTALGAGWVWRVPLYSRVGTGYVYSSQFRSDEEALAEFTQHIRAVGDLAPDAPDPELRVIRMNVGRVKRPWIKNCVALGLAGGFLEPLESTAIAMTETSARWVAGLLPDKDMSPELADCFNRRMEALYCEVRDFIVTQYYTSNRTEPYWQAARGDITLPGSLADRLALWRRVLPDEADTMGHRLFNYWNYIYTLQPKGFFEGCDFPLEGSLSERLWRSYSRHLAERKAGLLAHLPDHAELLADIRGEATDRGSGDGLSPQYRERAAVRPTVPVPGA